jgi:hypothetical protein
MKKPRKQKAQAETKPEVVESDLPAVEVVIESEGQDAVPVLTAEAIQRQANKARHSERYSAPKR